MDMTVWLILLGVAGLAVVACVALVLVLLLSGNRRDRSKRED
jgi:hypothetical protein